MKSGFIAILGRPNVGKSSLMNALVGEKISIVSPKSQTTRDRITGIRSDGDCQMIFVDTPGLHEARTALGEQMNRAARTAGTDADVTVVVLDGTKKPTDRDFAFIERQLKTDRPVYVVVNKTDLAGYERIYPTLEKLSYLTRPADGRGAVREIIPTSCRTGFNIDVLRGYLERELPDGEFFYPPDEITDKSERFLVAESIREKALLFLQDEIPHGIGVYIQSFIEEEKLIRIEADIICEKASHKRIVIGADGERLKTIGEAARREAEKRLGKQVYLKLFVKVRENWRDRKNVINDLESR